MTPPAWTSIELHGCTTDSELQRICELIEQTAGEQYTTAVLANLEFNESLSMILPAAEDIQGVILVGLQEPACCKIFVIAVSATYQRRGYGSAGIGILSGKTKALGIQKLTLDVRVDNSAAIGFYQRLGFEIDSTSAGFYHGVDGYRMSLKL